MTKSSSLLSYISLFALVALSAIILFFTLRGLPGNPTEQELNQPIWKSQGPFESSSAAARFALTYSLLENKSYFFSPYLAVLASPDLAINDDKFVSLFTPGVSYIIIPGYLVGKMVNLSQVGTFAEISLFALGNTVLLFILAQKLGAHPAAGAIASIIFLFATPAFSYGTTLSQHPVTTTFLLLCILILVATKHWLWMAVFWFLCAMAVVTDIPNVLFFLPVGIAGLRRFFSIKKNETYLKLKMHPLRLVTFLTALIPLLLFATFNTHSFGSPWKLGGSAPRATGIEVVTDEATQLPRVIFTEQHEQQSSNTNAISFFRTRRLMSGLYTHLFAKDRGTLFFAPVIFLAILGIPTLIRRHAATASLLLATISIILIVYSAWGDPYGGWAFGSRYLIPAYALLSLFLAIALTQFRRNTIFLLFFVILAGYSLAINTVGALTSSLNPPSVELVELEKVTGTTQPEGYERNVTLLASNKSTSLVFNLWANKYVTLTQYASTIGSIILAFILLQLLWLIFSSGEKHA